MPMTTELYMALLSMDSYNRGYGQRLNVVAAGGSITQIGNATIGTDALPAGAVSAGFFAQSYTLNGQKIIAYRGTDDQFRLTSLIADIAASDVWNGYTSSVGLPYNTQQRMAAEFFQTVTNTTTTDPSAGNAILTGHSLGGGFAGLIGSIYRQNAYLFDNMAFEEAALNAKLLSTINVDIKKDFYNDLTAAVPLIGTNLHAYATTGEFLAVNRLLQSTPVTFLDSNGGYRSPITLHSMALQTILQFAASPNSLIGIDWYAIGPSLWNAGFNVNVANAALAGVPTLGGEYTNEYKLLTAIAYSAIDEGVRVFGDTGIRAMFNDANDIGKVVKLADASTTVTAAKGSIAEILMQFAGQMAFGKVSQLVPGSITGALALSPDNSVLTVDFSDALWSLGRSGPPPTILGRDTLIDTAIGVPGSTGISDLRSGMEWLWSNGTTSVIDRIAFATTNAATTTIIPDRVVASPKATLFAAGGGADTITGSKDNDFIFGGGANDNAPAIRKMAA